MFTNKHDPLVDSVKSVMEKNNLRRQVEEALNEELGISSRKAVPHEHLASYDAMLEEAYKCAMKESNIKHPNQQKLDVHEPEKDELTAMDFKMLRAGKKKIEEKLTKSMSAGDVISDFVHSKNPKFKGKSKKKRMEMALGAYYSKHPEKSKKVDKSNTTVRTNRPGSYQKEDIDSIMEEIRANLEEKLVSVYESGDEQMFEEFVSSLTEEQLELLGLSEALGDVFGGPGSTERQSILNRASQQTYLNQQRQAAGQRTVSAARPTAAPTAAPTARPSSAPAAGRPTPAPAAKPATSSNDPAGKYDRGPDSNDPAGKYDPAPKQTPIKPTFEPRAQPAGTAASGTGTADLTPSPSTGIGKTLDGGTTPAPTPPTEKRGTAGAFARAAREQRAGSSDIGQQQESTHIKESLESMIRSKYLKG